MASAAGANAYVVAPTNPAQSTAVVQTQSNSGEPPVNGSEHLTQGMRSDRTLSRLVVKRTTRTGYFNVNGGGNPHTKQQLPTGGFFVDPCREHNNRLGRRNDHLAD